MLFKRKSKKKEDKPQNPDFVDYANTRKLREFHSYLKRVSVYFNNPLNELFRQRGMLLEILYAGKINDSDKELLRLEIRKIDATVQQIISKPITNE